MENICSNHTNTENLLKSFDIWHSNVLSLQRECNELKESLQAANTENYRLSEANKKVKNECETIHALVKDSNRQLERICILDEENGTLRDQLEDHHSEIEGLKTCLTQVKQKHDETLDKMKREQEVELTSQLNKIQTEAWFERELLQKQLSDREKNLEEAEEKHDKFQKSKDADLARLALEYENKLSRMQRMKTQSNQNQASSVSSDIFRKKLQNIKSEYEAEIASLKRKISDLEDKLANSNHLQPLRQRQTLSIGKRARMS